MNIPKNKKLVTTEEIAEMLGISRQGVHKMLHAGRFQTVEYVGSTRPTYLVEIAEVKKMAKARS